MTGGETNLMAGLQSWWSQPHFWYAVALPATLAVIVALRHRPETLANLGIWLVATLFSVASAYTSIRPLLGLAPDPYGVYTLPLFPIAYLIAGRYRVASRSVCFSGTFASMLATDLAVFGQRWAVGSADAWDTLVGIGAGRPVDGLVVAPLGAWVVAWLVGGMQRRGVEMRIFRSRRRG